MKIFDYLALIIIVVFVLVIYFPVYYLLWFITYTVPKGSRILLKLWDALWHMNLFDEELPLSK